MSDSREQSVPIFGFKGLDRSVPWTVPGYTRSLLNVLVREGKVKGRGGVTFDATLSAAMSENIAQLMSFLDNDSNLTTTLLRIGASKVEASTDAAAWAGITGTALTGATTDRPQYAMYRDKLYFTNEGQDRPRSYSGSGNTVVISTAPWAKAMMSYEGFLFLLNVSDDGTTFEPRQARYSETPDDDWTLCDGNELNFNETSGAIMTAQVFGRIATVIKEDGLVYLRWIGGVTRFSQELAKGAPGTLAPLAAQSIGEKGVIYLGTDYELWVAAANDVIPVPPRVNDILQNELHKPLVGNCRSLLHSEEETYYLFYPIDSSGNTGRIGFNFRTGECSHSTFTSHPWDAVATVRWTKEDAEVLIGAVNTVTQTMETTSKTDQTSATAFVTPVRRYDTDWIQYANTNEGRVVQTASKFTGATLICKADSYAKLAVSVAIDKKNSFKYRKIYDLRPVDVNDEYVAVRYDLQPIDCEWINLRIEFLPSATVNPMLHAGFLHFLPEPEKRDVRRSAGSAQE